MTLPQMLSLSGLHCAGVEAHRGRRPGGRRRGAAQGAGCQRRGGGRRAGLIQTLTVTRTQDPNAKL